MSDPDPTRDPLNSQHEAGALDEGRAARAANLFDLRRLIGGLFLIYGVILLILGIGASDAEIETARVEAEQFMEMYKKFPVRFAFSLIEILPVGIIVTFISAALLRKREILPAQPA